MDGLGAAARVLLAAALPSLSAELCAAADAAEAAGVDPVPAPQQLLVHYNMTALQASWLVVGD